KDRQSYLGGHRPSCRSGSVPRHGRYCATVLEWDRLENEMKHLAGMVLQLIQYIQNIPVPAAPWSHGGLPVRFGAEPDKIRTFIAQCELFMGARVAVSKRLFKAVLYAEFVNNGSMGITNH
ncbi:hypothetical protein E2320_003093, partial [Naja naja]